MMVKRGLFLCSFRLFLVHFLLLDSYRVQTTGQRLNQSPQIQK